MDHSELEISVFTAFAEGATELSAFDNALAVGGVQDANLIALSSVVPPNAAILRRPVPEGSVRLGDRLYCVLARQSTAVPGDEAWAGLRWAVDRSGRGGVFAEAWGSTEAVVASELDATIAEMVATRSAMNFAPAESAIIGGRCVDAPVCAVAIAAFLSEPWPTPAQPPR